MPRNAIAFALTTLTLLMISITQGGTIAYSQANVPQTSKTQKGVRVITIPVTSRHSEKRMTEDFQSVNPTVFEEGEEQRILSIRGIGDTPLSLAIVIQDDVVSSVANEIKSLGSFIRSLPTGSRVMVAYARNGSLDIRQKFTTDVEKAADSLRIPISSASAAPFNPYSGAREALKRFDPLPAGRRALMMITDGLDTRAGLDSSSPTLSLDLDRTIIDAQRRSVAVYAIYVPTLAGVESVGSIIATNGQGSLARLAHETGGQLYAQGYQAPVSFDIFLDRFSRSLSRQFAITYLSTHPGKGFRKIEITSDRPEIEFDYPRGYSR
jgi:VWFA-related protein